MVVVVKVSTPEDFSTEPQELHTEPVDFKTSSSSENSGGHGYGHGFFFIFFPFFYVAGGFKTQTISNKEAFEASKKIVSNPKKTHMLL